MTLKQLLWVAALSGQMLAASAAAANIAVEAIARDTYAVIRRDVPGYAVESNSLFIVCDREVIVVDAQSNAATTREVIAALREITPKPVRYVVNTHWHDDHIVGNQAYRDAFPDVEFIGHESSLGYLPREGKKNRQLFHAGIPQVLDQFRATLERRTDSQGEPLTQEQLASLRSDIALGERYLTVGDDFEPILPTLVVYERLTLRCGGRQIDVHYLGRGHTSSDLVVHLPQERIIATGDLVVWPIPLVGAAQSHVADWAVSLDRLLELRATIWVPGHGPLMRDDSYIRTLARLMRSVDDQVRRATADSKTLEQVRERVDLSEFRHLFAGDSKVRNALFSTYVVGPAVESAFNDVSTAAAAH